MSKVFSSSWERLRWISPLGWMGLALEPLLMVMYLSPMAVSDAIWAVESAGMAAKRWRATVIMTLTTRSGSVDPDSTTDLTLPTPTPCTSTGDRATNPVPSGRYRYKVALDTKSVPRVNR